VGKFCNYRFLSRKRYEIDPQLRWNTNRKSYITDRSVSVPMTLNDLERRDARGQIYLADLHDYDRMVWPRMTECGTVTQVGRSLFLGASHAFHLKGRGSSISKFLGPYLRPSGFTQSNQNLLWYTYGKERVLRDHPRPHLKGLAQRTTNLWDLLHERTLKTRTKFCMVIKLDVRKNFVGSTINADSRSVCGS